MLASIFHGASRRRKPPQRTSNKIYRGAMAMKTENKILNSLMIICTITILAVISISTVQAQGEPSGSGLDRVKLVDNEDKANEAKEASLARPERLTVVAPRHLRSRSDYHVLVNLANSEAPATIDLQLTGARDSDREQTEAKSLLINAGETQTIKFSIGDWPPAEYVLSVNAQAVDRSWNFTQETTLNYHSKSYSTLIQTDKAIYKPGQLVQFRAIFLNENFAPFVMKDEINVTVSDAKRNMIKQWTSLSNWRGLLSLDLQLSEDPVQGDWTIKVAARNQETSKQFQVAEYILPTYDVNIQLPSYATYNDSDIVATVKASYTYGKPVNGHVTLTVQPLVRFLRLSTRPLKQKQFRSRLVNGTANIEVDLVKDLEHEKTDRFEREIEFFALVEEDLTGRKYNKTEVLTIYNGNVEIKQINKGDSFKPGLSYLTKLKVAYRDDTPVEDSGPELELRYEAFGQTLEVAKLRPISGVVEHLLQVPRKISIPSESIEEKDRLVSLNNIELTATYRGNKHYLDSIKSYKSESGEYLQVSLPQLQQRSNGQRYRRVGTPSVSVNDELKVKVQSTEGMQQITCQGLARGDIIWALSPDADNKTEFEFEVKVDQRMTPEATIMCFYIRPENKEIIADSKRVQVNGLTRNLAKISTSRDEAKPGQEVEVGVFTKPNSLVGVLGIDQSVLLLRSGNDISQTDLTREIRSYANPSNNIFMDKAALNAEDLFEQADVVVLTNNLVSNGYGHRGSKTGDLILYSSLLTAEDYPKRIALSSLVLDHEIHPPEFHLSKQKSEPLVIRSQFPETWLWSNATAGPDGLAHFKSKMPDTITSWVLSAFSLSESSGFGLSTTRTSVRVFRPFFIKLNLPYSIIRGETISIQAVVFNYMNRPTAARVTLDNKNGDFEFVEAANNIEDERKTNRSSESRLIRIPAEDGVAVSFLITPHKLGHIDIQMTAQGEFAADGLVKKLLVKPEGQTQHLNRALLIDLPNTPVDSSLTRNYSIDVPANAVPGSQKVFVSVVGDIMGPGLSNVDDLLRLPYGCGEQNMINLVPNIVILNYLQTTKRLRDAQRVRAVRNIETGYQRQLNYKRSDGSFSAFGQRDKEGSVWLTAYVLKTLQQAKKIITVDEKVIRRAASYIASFSRKDGSIEEVGMVHDKNLQSSSAHGSAKAPTTYLTAYSMIALLQGPIGQDGDSAASVALDEVLERGLGFLEQQLDAAATDSESPYNLAIIAYALQLTNRHQAKDRAYEQLWSKAREEDDKIWWEKSSSSKVTTGSEIAGGASSLLDESSAEREFESIGRTSTSTLPPLKPLAVTKKHSAHLFVPDSLSIEMTALALLSTVKRGELDRALPIVRWLIGQQNSNGGFSSTQDTVLAIEALAAFAEATITSRPAPSINIELTYPRNANTNNNDNSIRGPSAQEELTVSRSNALLTQQLRLPDNITWVQVQARGSGLAVLQVAWQYNLLVSAEQPAFYLNPIIDKSSNINYLQLSICTFYKAGESSNMAVMEVELPSGYTADVESLPGLTRTKSIKRIDTAQGDTKVLVYLDRVGRDEICLTIPAHRTSKVSNNKPVPVSIYDYYNRQQAARIFYEPHAATSCEICDMDTCLEICSRKPKQTSGRLVSLHEQRKLNISSQHHFTQNSSANLQDPPTNGANPVGGQSKPGSGSLDHTQYLPLAPVLVTIVAAARNLYT